MRGETWHDCAFSGFRFGADGQSRPGDRINLGVASIMATGPKSRGRWAGLTAALRASRHAAPRLVELIRLRIAFHNQCRSCMAVRYRKQSTTVSPRTLVCSLERPAEADDLRPPSAAQLRFADLFATNHLAIDDSCTTTCGGTSPRASSWSSG